MQTKSLKELEAQAKFYADEVEKLRLKQKIARHKENIERMKRDPTYDSLAESLNRL